jgi:hypothetical protein
LRGRGAAATMPKVAEKLPLDRDDVVTIMGALFDIHVDIEHVISLLEEDDEEEAQEEDTRGASSG